VNGARSVTLVEEFLPVWDVSDAVATVVEADVGSTWDAVMRADMIELGRTHPMVGLLGGLRALPDIVSHILHGELPERGPAQLRLQDMAEIPLGEGGWVLLGERPRDELLLGLVGKFWRPVWLRKRRSASPRGLHLPTERGPSPYGEAGYRSLGADCADRVESGATPGREEGSSRSREEKDGDRRSEG
jgi:hypothetical protein